MCRILQERVRTATTDQDREIAERELRSLLMSLKSRQTSVPT